MSMDHALAPIHFGSFIAGRQVTSRNVIEIRSPYDGHLVGSIAHATDGDVARAIEVAHSVFVTTMKTMPAFLRSDILRRAADLLERRTDDFVKMLAQEAGKPVRESRSEVGRAVQVLRFASEGAKQIHGEEIPLDSAVGGENTLGFTRRHPLGVIVAITPFNFPLNLVLHKIAPAIAAGNTVVLKPSEKTPFSAALLHDVFHEAGLPAGALNVIMGTGVSLGKALVQDARVKKVTFTGSGGVGWRIREIASTHRVTLELGSNAPNIVFADADLDTTATALTIGAFSNAGQACISAQRVYIEHSIYDKLVHRLVALTQNLRVGDPLDEQTDIGPMITVDAAQRAEEWIREAVDAGAKILTGGQRTGALLQPTILSNVTSNMRVVCNEVFAPIFTVIPFHTEPEVVQLANDSELGLHAGIFTRDINRALRVADQIETGGVWINDVSTKRYDHIPYGGVKQSGVGKEGVPYAIREMTDEKFYGIRIR